MATRGNLGGLSRATVDAVAILDAAGFDKVIVETVGVGQDEVEIVKTADVSVVVLVPGMGDDIQAIKAGIMEIGDVFVINKADREGVLRTQKELEALLGLAHRPDMWNPPIVKTVATENKGIEDLAAAIESYRRVSEDRRRDVRPTTGDRPLAASRTAAGTAAFRPLEPRTAPAKNSTVSPPRSPKKKSDPYSAVEEAA